MALVHHWGLEIFLTRFGWEVWSPSGVLLAEGRGGLQAARDWILQDLLIKACQLGLVPRH